MHVALQTARNQASLETPLRAEELMSAHFNLAVLSNEIDSTKMPDAPKPEANILDAGLLASTVEEETYVKIPSRNYAANSDSKKQHPTRAVAPTCRREYREYRQVTRLMTLGTMILILMSTTTGTHTHTT